MNAAQWLAGTANVRIDHAAFACLDGCGFCCTYPPQVTEEGVRAIQARTGEVRTGIDPQGRVRLPLQGGCGGCVLLEGRQCRAYDLRPHHCRLFPFHLYFGRTVEVYANRVCPGLDPAPHEAPADQTSDVRAALARAVSEVAPEELEGHRRRALEVHAAFEGYAREAGVWADPEQARWDALERVSVTEEGWAAALSPFQAEDDALLPTMVLPGPDFEWRLWRLDDEGLQRFAFDEGGRLEHRGTATLGPLPTALSDPVRAVLHRLVGLECFVGAALDLVDASDYERAVDGAVQQLVDEVAAALMVRERLVQAEGLEADQRWLAAAYEPDFFDLPTIGGWL